MGIYRTVKTEVTCDKCEDLLFSWLSTETGVSRGLAGRFVRMDGATTGKRGVICKECRIKEKQEKCRMIKTLGHPGKDEEGKCKGFKMLENCKKCIANAEYDWEEERKKRGYKR